MNWLVLAVIACLTRSALPASAHSKTSAADAIEGQWKVERAVTYAYAPIVAPDQEKQYIGQVLSIIHKTASLASFHETLAATKQWDTQSSEWRDEFRTNPQELGLPRWVTVYDLRSAEAILTQRNKLLIDIGGTWYVAVKMKSK